ncbi:hypothetical protein [Natrinema altunense]|uniref:BPP domain-containing protein n=1 Tax=Natrinema altunense TaxID=222984 RepID=A0A482XU84_9EURY|nr:hypothetical protein [Natrinema altunense]RZH66699.1 hypothetical protein ELS17_12975 [Natrinema altunense]
MFVIDDLAVVVERDNRRIQVIRLPDRTPLGTFGQARLRKPYGCTVFRSYFGYELFVTDDYDASAVSELDERVKHYRFTVTETGIDASHVNTFGATEKPGALSEVETIYADPVYNRLAIADERASSIKLYDLAGNFVSVGPTVFDADPEGLDLYTDDEDGYWLCTDQIDERSRFHVFDRDSFDHRATFRGERTADTDGVWLTQQEFGPFSEGAFFAVHADRSVSAFDWEDIEAIVDDD